MNSNPRCLEKVSPCGKNFRRKPRGKMRSGTPKGGLMSNSGIYPTAPIGGWQPLQIKPMWCPLAGGSRHIGSAAGRCNHPTAPIGGWQPLQIKPMRCPLAGGSRHTGSAAGRCNHPLSQSLQTFNCHRIPLWKAKLVGWGLCTPILLKHPQHMLSSFFHESDVIRNGWTPEEEEYTYIVAKTRNFSENKVLNIVNVDLRSS